MRVLAAHESVGIDQSEKDKAALAMYGDKGIQGHDEWSRIVSTFFDATAVLNLNTLLGKRRNAKLVLVSDWRLDRWTRRDLYHIFDQHEFGARFIGCIKERDSLGEGILLWLRQHQPDRFVILATDNDDIGQSAEQSELNEHLVKIPFHTSELLTKQHCELAMTILDRSRCFLDCVRNLFDD